jgi:hypothetical protein
MQGRRLLWGILGICFVLWQLHVSRRRSGYWCHAGRAVAPAGALGCAAGHRQRQAPQRARRRMGGAARCQAERATARGGSAAWGPWGKGSRAAAGGGGRPAQTAGGAAARVHGRGLRWLRMTDGTQTGGAALLRRSRPRKGGHALAHTPARARATGRPRPRGPAARRGVGAAGRRRTRAGRGGGVEGGGASSGFRWRGVFLLRPTCEQGRGGQRRVRKAGGAIEGAGAGCASETQGGEGSPQQRVGRQGVGRLWNRLPGSGGLGRGVAASACSKQRQIQW